MSLRELWLSFPEPKANYNQFYNRVKCFHYPVEVAIQLKLPKKERKSEMRLFRESYEGEKCGFGCFRERIKKKKLDYETAIQPQLPKELIVTPDTTHRPQLIAKTHAQAKAELYHENYYFIDVTYPTEEAKIFHNIYCGIIDKLEQQILEEENYSTLRELEEKLEFIKQQYLVFLSYNPL